MVLAWKAGAKSPAKFLAKTWRMVADASLVTVLDAATGAGGHCEVNNRR